MRLKFLFFPIMLVMSISVFVGYIWPEIDALKAANIEKMTHEVELKAIADKRVASELVNKEIDNDQDGTAIVYDYLPSKKVEERILAGINFLATDSSVSLVNISLKDSNPTSSADAASINPINTIVPGADTSQVAPSQAPQSNVQYSEATIYVIGDYSKIRLFIDQLQKFAVFNNIKSVTINSQGKGSSSTDTEKTESTNLYATIIADFGWMSPVKIDDRKTSKFQPDLDSNTIAVLKQYVSQKIPSVESNGDKDGKLNPFIQ